MSGTTTKIVFIVAASVSIVAGCASQPASESDEPGADDIVLGTQACFYRRQVMDFRALDRSNLIVYAPNKSNAYQVRISSSSTGLRYADAIAFESRTSRICGYAGERLVLNEAGGARGYSIVSIYRLDEAGHEALLAQYGKGPAGRALEPQPIDGAQIERDIDPEQQSESGSEGQLDDE